MPIPSFPQDHFFSSMLQLSKCTISTAVSSSSSTLLPSPLPPSTSVSSSSSYANQFFPFLFGLEINAIFWTIRGGGDRYCLSTVMKRIWAWRTHQNNLRHLTRRLGTTLSAAGLEPRFLSLVTYFFSSEWYSQFSNVFWHYYAQTLLILNVFFLFPLDSFSLYLLILISHLIALLCINVHKHLFHFSWHLVT